MNQQEQLYNLLCSFLYKSGKSDVRKSEYEFYCPQCKYKNPHFWVNTDLKIFHCWACNYKGSIVKLILSYDNKNILQEYYGLVGKDSFNLDESILDNLFGENKKSEEIIRIDLPKGFRSLSIQSEDPDYSNILKYLNKRGIDLKKIKQFNLGWSDEGIYRNRVIIPSYDINGNLNYYTARSIYDDEEILRYKNCDVSWSQTIPFEIYVNWFQPIIFVEGPFDFLKHANLNVIPLLGNNISNKLLLKLISYNPDVYIMLDIDMQKKAIEVTKLLNSFGINTYLVDTSKCEFKDPAMMTSECFVDILNNNSSELSFEMMITSSLSDI